MARILVVEDDPFLNKAYQTMLVKEGYDVDAAQDGLQGITMAGEREYDLILLDMLMPQLGGIDFLRLYKQKDMHPNTKVVVFSNMSTPDTQDEAMHLGATKYITKAMLSPSETTVMIRKLLRR